MKDTFRFPNGGYEFTVARKEDILECIEANITDKEVILEIVKQLEIDATNFINEGRWTGIPFLGSIKNLEGFKMQKSKEQEALLNDAFNTLDRNEYVMFRHQLAVDNDTKIRENRRFKYIASMSAQRNKKLYKKLCKNYDENRAQLLIYSLFKIVEAEHFEEYDN